MKHKALRAVVYLAVIAAFGYGFYQSRTIPESAPTTLGESTLNPAPITPDDSHPSFQGVSDREESVTQAVNQLLTQRGFPLDPETPPLPGSELSPDWYFAIDRVAVDESKEWATVSVVPKYRKSGKIVPTEPTFLLAHKVGGIWVSALPDMPEFKMWLGLIPPTFMSAAEKANLKSLFNLE